MNYKKLLDYRKILNITLDDVARENNLSIGYISRIERGFITRIKSDKKRILFENYLENLKVKVIQKLETISI